MIRPISLGFSGLSEPVCCSNLKNRKKYATGAGKLETDGKLEPGASKN